MQQFHDLLPSLLRPGGLYSYFNGFAPDNGFFHAVYCSLVTLEMARLGLETHFVDLPVSKLWLYMWHLRLLMYCMLSVV